MSALQDLGAPAQVTPQFDHPLVLWALPLALLVWWWPPRLALAVGSLQWIPQDRLSNWVSAAERLAGGAVVALLVLGVAQPRAAPESVQRVGRGAHVVLLLDRSSSMDQAFAGSSQRQPLGAGRLDNTKSEVARRLLTAFVARRPRDLFAMVLFSTRPIRTIPLSDKQPLVQAAIAAAGVGRGLAETDVGAALERGLDLFEGRPYTGSRVVLLVSDGAATLDLATQTELRQRLQGSRVALYWLYIRSRNGPQLVGQAITGEDGMAPERVLDRFFRSLDIPYRAWSAEDASALEAALDEIAQLQNLPMHYQEIRPGRPLARLCYGLALALLVPLAAAVLTEAREWPAR